MSGAALIGASLAVPLAGAVLVLMSDTRPNQREGATLVTAGVLFVCVMALLPQVLAGERPTLTLLEPVAGLPISFTAEPLGMIFAGVAGTLWIVNSIYSIGYMRGNQEQHQTRFYCCFAIAIASAMGIAFAGNMFTLFICYEVLSLSTFPLVTHKGTPEARRGGMVYLGLLLGTSIGFQLLAIGWTWVVAGTLDFTDGGVLAGKVEGWPVAVLLLLYMYGIGKAALMPFHRWLPAAMVAPTPVSALLHAVAVVKAGVFTVVKVIVYIFGVDNLAATGIGGAADWLVVVAGFTIIAASVVALNAGCDLFLICHDNDKAARAIAAAHRLVDSGAVPRARAEEALRRVAAMKSRYIGAPAAPSLAEAQPGDKFQFMRMGYFWADSDHRPNQLIFNRTATLRDTWTKNNQ